MKKINMLKSALASLAIVLSAGSMTFADSIELTSTTRDVAANETVGGAAVGGSAPDGGTVYEFFATTDGDILAINFVNTTLNGGDFYQNTFGVPGAAPNPALVAAFAPLAADSYITTPGGTSILGGGLPADGDDTFGDTEDNGPQANFKFGQLTIPAGATGSFSGQFDIVGSSGVFSQQFDFALGAVVGAEANPASGTDISLQAAFDDLSDFVAGAITITGDTGIESAIVTDGVGGDIFEAEINGLSVDLRINGDNARDAAPNTAAAAALQVITADGSVFDYTLSATVPEPATMSMIGLALVGLVGMRRRS